MKIARKQLRQIIKVELIREAGKKVGPAANRDHAYESMKKALRDAIRVKGFGNAEEAAQKIIGPFKNYYSKNVYDQAQQRIARNMTRPVVGDSGPRRTAQKFAWLGFDSCDDAKKFVSITDDGGQIIIKKTVQFVTGKADIKPESLEVLDAVVCIMNNPSDHWIGRGMGNLRVEGHTDNVGEDDMNMRLSQERAESVAAALVKAGLSEERVTSVGFGESRPVEDNSTENGRNQNRRVEFHLVRN